MWYYVDKRCAISCDFILNTQSKLLFNGSIINLLLFLLLTVMGPIQLELENEVTTYKLLCLRLIGYKQHIEIVRVE